MFAFCETGRDAEGCIPYGVSAFFILEFTHPHPNYTPFNPHGQRDRIRNTHTIPSLTPYHSESRNKRRMVNSPESPEYNASGTSVGGIGLTQTFAMPAQLAPGARQFTWIDIALVRPNPHQPRRRFSERSIAELADSIEQYGLLSPIVVRRMESGEYQLIAGERRLRALKKLGQTHAEAIVLTACGQDAALIALIENLQREELHFFEEAEAFEKLTVHHGMSQEELARRLSKHPSTIANRLRLLKLPALIRARVTEASLTERHARALLRLHGEIPQRQALEQIIERNLSVRQAETLIESLAQATQRPQKRKMRVICRDHRMLINALMDTVHALQQADDGVTSRIIDKEDCVEVVVTVPRGGVGRRIAASRAAQTAIRNPAQ